MFDVETLKWTLPVLVAVLGWFAAHQFNVYRDRQNKRRDLRIQYLLEAYRRLEGVANRSKKSEEQALAFESAIADIQLLGSNEQIAALIRYIQRFTASEGAQVDEVLELLRADLRRELSLPVTKEKALVFRFIRPDP